MAPAVGCNPQATWAHRGPPHRDRSPVKLAAIGIGVDVSQCYGNVTRIAKIDDLGLALT